MRQIKLTDRRTIECAILAASFPLWGVGAFELLVRTAAELPQSTFEFSESAVKASVAGLFSLTLLLTGIAFLIRAVWLYQVQRMQFISESINASASSATSARDEADGAYDQDYESSKDSKSFENLSYTRLWYMSFQNHLISKSGFDTLQLSPLKRWPAILQKQMAEDLVPVWNFPLLLIVVASIPALALLIAGIDRVFSIFTGASFCAGCYESVNAISSLIASTLWHLLNNPTN